MFDEQQQISTPYQNFSQIFHPLYQQPNFVPHDFFPNSSFSPPMQNDRPITRNEDAFLENNLPSTSRSSMQEIRDDECSDSDISEVEEDRSESNPYFSVINSDLPRKKPPNWHSLVLFNGRLKLDDLPPNMSKPQLDDGSLLPQIRDIVKNFINSDGTLSSCHTILTMKSPSGPSSNKITQQEIRGFVSANGRAWFRTKPVEHSKPASSVLQPQPQVSSRKRFANQSLVIAGGKRIHIDNSNECVAFANGKCIANNLCKFDHNGKSDHREVKLCRDQMLGYCRNDSNCSKGLHIQGHQMPICNYFLRMTCFKDKCPYLHIKHQDSLEYCAAFQKGSCLLGLKCQNPHRYTMWIVNSKCGQGAPENGVKKVPERDEDEPINTELPNWYF